MNEENKIHIHTKRKTNPSKRHPKTIQQIHPTRKHPYPNGHPNPLNTPSNPPQKPYIPKRKCISLQTPKRLLPNARTFHLKRKYVCLQTQRRFPPLHLPKILHPNPKNAPKSPKMRRPCFQIPQNLPISYLNHPLQKPSEMGIFPKVPINLLRKKSQKATKITI